jgi:glycosyltransferase involved in cell wall biosynthesis
MLCPGGLERAGGIGRFVSNFIEEAGRQDPSLRFELIDTRGTGHIALAPFHLGRALIRIAGLAVTGKAVLLHVNLASRGSAARKYVVLAVAEALRVPVVLHLHGALFDRFYIESPHWVQARLRWMFRKASRVLVLGPHWRAVAVNLLGADPGRVQIVCNGVPSGEGERKNDDGLHVVFLGRLEERKGVSDLIAALAAPALRDLPWRATLAGDGDPRPYAAQAHRLGIGDRIAFPGWLDRKETTGLLRSASVLALPSKAEGLPMVVLEALANGVPVVTTPVGAIPDFLEDQVSALFHPPGDASALARALDRLMRSEDDRRALAAGGRLVFQRHFDIGTVTREILATYRTVTDRRQQPVTKPVARGAS